jgi:hypothetical protein
MKIEPEALKPQQFVLVTRKGTDLKTGSVGLYYTSNKYSKSLYLKTMDGVGTRGHFEENRIDDLSLYDFYEIVPLMKVNILSGGYFFGIYKMVTNEEEFIKLATIMNKEGFYNKEGLVPTFYPATTIGSIEYWSKEQMLQEYFNKNHQAVNLL